MTTPTLTQAEAEALNVPEVDVAYGHVRALNSALPKLTKPIEAAHCAYLIALAIDRSIRPGFEKSRAWATAARVYVKLPDEQRPEPASAMLSKAAHYSVQSDNHQDAATLFEAAASLEPTHANAQRWLRLSSRSFEIAGDPVAASRLFTRERDLALSRAKGFHRYWLHFFRSICLYGESPGRVAYWALVTILFCTGLYTWAGLESSSGIRINSVAESLYFSIVTFATLGYGDYAPVRLAKIVAAGEALTGLFLTSLFLVTIVRRFTR